MPLYEYECGACGRFELIRKFSDPPLDVCPTCGGAVRKLLSSPAIQFKGTGWYITDYSDKGKAARSDNGKSGKDTGGEKAAGKPAGESTSAGSSSSSSDSASSSSTKPEA